MEDLTKTQIVLLCLLVSFVTSIGTGIISYSLLQETPTAVTQTINRVVERTIERVTLGEDKITTPQEVQTVIVKDSDLVVDAIATAQKSIVRIDGLTESDTASTTVTTYGIGFIISKDGTIVARERADDAFDSYAATFPNGKIYSLTRTESGGGFVRFTVNPTKDDTTVFVPVTFGKPSALVLGETVISISGSDYPVVSVGRVAGIQKDAAGEVGMIETDILAKDSVRGGPLINISGAVVGFIDQSTIGTLTSFKPAGLIEAFISAQNNA